MKFSSLTILFSKRNGCQFIANLILTYAMSCTIGITTAFNVDTLFPTVIRDPSSNSGESYFGYTLQFLFGQTDSIHRYSDWLLVGAPKANSSYPEHATLVEPGVLYSCSLNRASVTLEKCSQIVVQKKASELSNEKESAFRGARSNGWLGGSLFVNNASNGRVGVCAHRWTNRVGGQEYVNGACYWSDHAIHSQEDFNPLRPLVQSKHQLTSDKLFDYGRGQAGFSVHMAQRDGTEEMIIGAPGVFDWTGTIIRVSDFYHDDDNAINTRRKKRGIIPFGESVVANVSQLNQIQPYDYFGYSVFSGRFFSSDKLSYVAGAPRGAGMKGKVLVFDFDEKNLRRPKVLVELNGTQLGEYYGASLMAGSLNMDNLDELLIGAPQHTMTNDASATSGDEGKVYVYVNKGGNLIEALPLYGNKVKGARFGSAISLLGDINRDNFNDVAVGAPYENDRGAVYIYLGGKGGIDYHPVTGYWQRISPSDFPSLSITLRGFGISISAGDVDRNGYTDLAVGSYLSGHAVILRSRPVIKFSYTMTPLNRDKSWKIGPNDEVAINTCFSFMSPANGQTLATIGGIDVYYEFLVDAEYLSNPRLSLEVSGRIVTQQPYNFTEKLPGPDSPKCRTFTVRVLDFSKPAKLRISANLFDTDTKSGFCAKCPVRDEKLDKFYEQKMSFTSECGADEICQEDLELKADFSNSLHSLVIGSKKVIEFQVSVKNYGEPSYVTRVDLFLPVNTTLELSGNGQCAIRSFGELVYSCNLQTNPLKTSATNTMKLYLGVSNLPSGLDNLKILIEARVGSGAARGRQTMFNLTLPLKTEIDLEILGSPPLEQRTYQVLNGTRNATRDRLPLEHGFEIRNVLSSPADEIDVEILLPVSLNENGKSISLMEQNITVKTSQRGRPSKIPCNVSQVLEPNDRKLKATAEFIKKSLIYPSDSINKIAHRVAVIDCLDSANVRCRIVSCTARSLAKGAEVGILVSGAVLLQSILDHTGNHDDFVLSSVARVSIKNPGVQQPNLKPDVAIVSTHILPQGPPAQQAVASWIIALAVLAGVALLGLSAYGLQKVGFFKRQRIPQDELIRNADDGAAGEIDRHPQPVT